MTNGRLVCITSLSSRGLATVIVSSGPARRDLKHQILCFQITLGPRQTKEIIRKRGKLRPKLKNSLKELMPFDNRLVPYMCEIFARDSALFLISYVNLPTDSG